jgi:cytochrome c553
MDGWLTLWNVDDHNADAIQLGDHANPFNDSTEATKLTQFCLNCHDSNGAAAEASPLAPFTGSGAPPVIDSTHWSNSSHNTGGENGASPVTCFGDGQGGCHASGHGSEKQWLLAPYTVPATDPDRSEERENFCFTCHDTTSANLGMSTLKIQDDFSGAPINATSDSGALVNNRHDVLPTDQSRSGGLVTCKNCHNQHQNNNSDPVADPDDDVLLPSYSISNVYNEDGHNFSYDPGGNLDPLNPEGCAGTPGCTPTTEPDYIKFCLACHDGTTPPGVTMSPNMVNMAAAWDGTDQHGTGEGSNGPSTSKGGLKVPWVSPTTAQNRCTPNDDAANCDPSAGYAAMNCTTCHGAHGGPNIYNLKTSINVDGVTMTVGGVGNLNEPSYNGSTTYTLPLIGGAQTDHYWGAWCTFCHKMDSHPGKVEADACTGGHMHAGGAF